MKWTDGAIFALIGMALILVVFREGGWALVRSGLSVSGKMFIEFLPVFVMGFLIVGQSKVLIELHMDTLRGWITGSRGIFSAWMGGMFVPGGMIIYPLFREWWRAGEIRLPFIATFIVSFSLLNWQNLLFRATLLGWELTLITLICFVFVPLVVGGLLLLGRF